MGRPRKHNRHLPECMFQRRGAYYFVKDKKWLPLGREYGAALMKYAALVGSPHAINTVKDAVWAYIEHRKPKLAAATLEGYRRSATNLCAVFGHMPLSDITPAMVYRYVSDKGTVQANRDKALMSAAFTHARNTGNFEGVDPTKRLQFRNEELPRDRYVTDDEMTRLIAAASPKLACIARFIELTGMRQSDALRVKLDDMDAEGIHYKQGKTGKRLVVLWSPELKATVAESRRLWCREGRVYLFESKPKGLHGKRGPGPYTTSGLRALWRVAREKAKLKDVRLHDLRAKAGSDVEAETDAQRLLGHADGKVTRRHYRRKADRVNPLR